MTEGEAGIGNGTLQIAALGGLEIFVEGERVDSSIPLKAALMLVYLADAGAAVRRSVLAGLLWSDVSEDRARGNLRLALTRLRAVVGDHVTADRDSVSLVAKPVYDVATVEAGESDSAFSIYKGEFLAGIDADGAPLFDEWASGRREGIRKIVVARLSRDAHLAQNEGDWERCLHLAEMLTDLEPWDESAERLAIEALAETTGAPAGLERYRRFVERMSNELGLGPDQQTAELARSLSATRVKGTPTPRTAYAACDGLSIAYQEFGSGDIDILVVPSFVSHLDLIWADPAVARWLSQVAEFARVVMFDKLGTGLSDPVPSVRTIDARAREVDAVIAASGLNRPAILGMSEGTGVAMMYAASHPERVRALVLFGAFACLGAPPQVESPDLNGEEIRSELGSAGWKDEHAPSAEQFDRLIAWQRDTVANWGDGSSLRALLPNQAGRGNSLAILERSSASPGMARATLSALMSIDVTPIVSAVRVPTLVIHARDDLVPIQFGRYVADTIPGAEFFEIAGADHAPWLSQPAEVLEKIERFLTCQPQSRPPDRMLSTVLVANIVGLVTDVEGIEDHRRSQLLEEFHTAAHEIADRHGGRGGASVADGYLSTFTAPTAAIDAGQDLIEYARRRHIEIRAGAHTGEVEVNGDDLGGLAVATAISVSERARPMELLVSQTICDLTIGSSHEFGHRGSLSVQVGSGELELFALVVEPGGSATSSLRATLAQTATPPARESMTIGDRALARVARRSPQLARKINDRFG